MATRAGTDEETNVLINPRPRNVEVASLVEISERGGIKSPVDGPITCFFSGIGVVSCALS